MPDITKYSPQSGRYIAEDGSVHNFVDELIAAGSMAEPVGAGRLNITQFAARSGRFIAEDGKVYNLKELLDSAGGAGGQIYSDTTEGWNAQRELIGAKNALYIYTDHREADGKTVPGLKVGDGKAYLIDVPFLDVGQTAEVTEEDIARWNEKVSCKINESDEENLILYN